jgi:hypothetical protein
VADLARSTVAAEWFAGLRWIPGFWLSGFSRITNTSKFRWSALSVLVAAAWTIGLPWLVEAILHAAGQGPLTPTAASGIQFTAIGAFLVVVFSGFGWALVARHTNWGEEFLSEKLRTAFVGWLKRCYQFQWVSWIFGAGVLTLIWWLLPESRIFFPTDMAGWISLAQFGIAASTVLYMIAVLPGSVTRVTRAHPTELHVYRLDPASTPAMRLITEIVTGSSLLILLILIIETVAWIVLRATHSISPDLTVAIALGYAAGLVALARTSLVPTLLMHWWIVRLKVEILGELESRLTAMDARRPTPWGRGNAIAERSALVDEFFYVANTTNLPFRTDAILQFSTAVLGSVVAFVLGWVFGTPST